MTMTEEQPWLPLDEIADKIAGPRTNGKGPHKKGREMNLLPILGMHFEDVHWLWNQYIALGKVTVLAGLAGQGKSQLSCMVAAMASRGALNAPAGDTLIVSGEDDPRDTIGPRLLAAGGDPAHLHILDVREHHPDGTVSPTVLSMPDDARNLSELVKQLKAPRLLVLDPVSAFLGSTDAHRNAEVRHALGPLKAMAEDMMMAILILTHLNKSTGVEPLVRVADSGAFTALARGVLLMAPDPDDDDGDRGKDKILAVAKSNLADTGEHSLMFRISPTDATDDHGKTVHVTALRLTGRSQLSASDLLTPVEVRSAMQEARLWLREELADDQWRPAKEMKAAAAEAGIAARTLQSAREMECQRPKRIGGTHGKWFWGLRGAAAPDEGVIARARGTAESTSFTSNGAKEAKGVRNAAPPRAHAEHTDSQFADWVKYDTGPEPDPEDWRQR